MCIFAQERRYNPLIWLNARDWRVNGGLTIDINQNDFTLQSESFLSLKFVMKSIIT